MPMLDKQSLLESTQGAVLERFDREMSKLLDNILDPNTKATAERSITVTVKIIPDESRRTFRTSATTVFKPAPMNPVESMFTIDTFKGETAVREMVPYTPGQMDMFGGEQKEPPAIRILKQA